MLDLHNSLKSLPKGLYVLSNKCRESFRCLFFVVIVELLLALGNALAPRSPDVKYYKYTNTNSNRKQTSLCFSYLFVVLVLLILRQIRHHCTYFFFSISFDIYLHYVYCLCSIYREFGHIMYGYVPFTERLSICDLGS